MNEVTVWVKLEKIDCLKLNKIRDFKPESEKYQNLKRAIAEDGYDSSMPILCRPMRDQVTNELVPEMLEVCNGQHRYNACKELEIEMVAVIIREMNDKDMARNQYKLNESVPTSQREKCNYFKRFLSDNPNMTQTEVATDHGITPTELSNVLKLDKLIPEAVALLDKGKLKATAAIYLATIPTDHQKDFLKDAMSKPTGEFAEYVQASRKAIAQAMREGTKVEKIEFPPKLISLSEARDKLNGQKELLEATDVNSDDYSRLTGWVQCAELFLQIDAETIALKRSIKERDSQSKALERAQKRGEEATKNISEIVEKNRAMEKQIAEAEAKSVV